MLNVSDLAARVGGPVLTPADPGFSDEISGYNLAIPYTPDVVVGVTKALLASVGADATAPLIDEWVSPETTINFAGDPHDQQHFESAWPAAIGERLDAVRLLYDPSKVFTYGPPAG